MFLFGRVLFVGCKLRFDSETGNDLHIRYRAHFVWVLFQRVGFFFGNRPSGLVDLFAEVIE